MKKSILRNLVVVALLLGLLFAAMPTQQAQAADLTITSLTEFEAFRDAVNAGDNFAGSTVTLATDIDLTGVAWVPIGTSSKTFAGIFDGGNYTISNVTVDTPTVDQVGLFGSVSGTVKNLNLNTVSIAGNQFVGGLIGYGYPSAKVINVHVTSVTVNSTHWAGGLVGYLYGQALDCSVTNPTVTTKFNTIKNDDGDKAGGLVGFLGENSVVQNCVVTNVNITGVRDVGGLIGNVTSGTRLWNNTVNGGTVTALQDPVYSDPKPYAGGLVGRASGTDNIIYAPIVNNVTATSYDPAFAGPVFGGPAGNAILNYVHNTTQDVWYATISEAITASVDNDVIEVYPGTYYENVDTGDTRLINGLTVRGIADANGNYPKVIGSMKFGIPRRADYGQYDHNNLVLENFRIEANLTDTSEYDYGNNVKYRHALMVSNFEGAQLRNLELVSTATNITDITYGITVHAVAKDYTIENVTIENFELGVYGRADNLTIKNSDISRVQSGVNIMSGENLVITDSSIVVEVTNKNRDFYVVRFAEGGGPFFGTGLQINKSTLAITNPNGYGPWDGKYMRSLVLRAAAGGVLEIEDSHILQGVLNNSSVTLDATRNYWGSATGPDLNNIDGDVDYMPFWIDPEMTTLVDADAPVLHYSGEVNVPGGIHIWLPNTQVYLAADTVIRNESPCFVIHADNVKIDAQLGAKCIPTNGSDGVYIDDGLSGIRVSGLEIDGTGQTTNHGIHVDGVINNYVFISNRIHNLGGDGIHFAAQPTGIPTVVDISGNLFYANTGVGVNNPAGTENVIAQFNAWGDPEGPTGTNGDGVGANVDSDNFTHVDLSLASSGPVWTDQVVRGPHTLHMKGRPIVLKDGNTYHMWAGLNDTTLIHYESTDPTFADAGAGTETTYDNKPIEVGSVAVVKEGDVFYMIAYGSTDQVFNIYTSSDGNSWLNKGLIFNSVGKEGLSGGKVDAPSIILDGTGSKIYFQYGKPVRNIYMISTTQTLSAIADGDNDEDYTFDTTINPVLRPTEEDLASTMLFHPWVVKDGTKYYMYYTAYSPNVPTFRARMATSNDGEVWTFHSPNPVMQATSAEPSVFKDGDTWRMYFLGNGSKVGYVSGKGPAAFNETITYSVKANLTNVNGAEFTLTYPEILVYIGAAGDGNFTVEEVSHNSATRTVSFLAYQFNTMVSGTGLDILKVNFAGKTAGTDLPMDLGFNLAGGFTTNSPGSSQIVFPMGLVDGKVTVFDLPTITSTYADDYYLIGDAQDFEVTVTNTTGTFATTELRLTIPTGLTLTLDGQGYSLVGSTVDLGELAANETITLTFTATFSAITIDPLRFDLYDTAVDPDFELAAVSSIATVYTKPMITTDGLTGNHLGLDVPFTVTISNLSDMTPVTFMLDLGFPDGTVVSYGGTNYACGTSGCQIPVTLTVPTTVLDFTATFPGAYDDDVVVTLYDSLADPDRPLATETVTGVVVVPNAGTITGTITMQGRTTHEGAIMILTPPTGAPFGPYQATSTDAIGINIQFTNVAGATYTITTNTPRYLNVPDTLNKTIDVMVKQSIAPLRLIGGNAVYTDNVINISDSGLIGAQYGNTGPQWDGDVNFDGVVNIRDLALVGGNYLLTSVGENSVYNSWLP